MIQREKTQDKSRAIETYDIERNRHIWQNKKQQNAKKYVLILEDETQRQKTKQSEREQEKARTNEIS